MNSLKALLMMTLMTASVAAMAEGGGDKVTERMDQARAVAMAHYQQDEHHNHAQAIASAKEKNTDVDRSN